MSSDENLFQAQKLDMKEFCKGMKIKKEKVFADPLDSYVKDDEYSEILPQDGPCKEGVSEEIEIKEEVFADLLDSSFENEGRVFQNHKPAVDKSSKIRPQDVPCKEEDIGEISCKKQTEEEFVDDPTPVEEIKETDSKNGNPASGDDSRKVSQKNSHQSKIASKLSRKHFQLDPMFVPTNEHIQHVMLYEFHRGVNASVAAKSIQSTYGADAVCERTCRRWFTHFRKGDQPKRIDKRGS